MVIKNELHKSKEEGGEPVVIKNAFKTKMRSGRVKFENSTVVK
jgi:hypothetical protein